VAVSQTARRLARESGEADPEHIARAGFLHRLGWWAVAAVEPDWLADWLDEPDPRRRRERELRGLGVELTTLGRVLAERWGCDPLLVDAAWLHADGALGLNGAAASPARLAFIQEAYTLAERTPWGFSVPEHREPSDSDLRLRILVAEVQVRCGAAFVEQDASPHEERLSRSNARLRLELARVRAERSAGERFLRTFTEAEVSDHPETWAERAGRAWCGEPGVSTARVVWVGPGADDSARAGPVETPPPRVDRVPAKVGTLGEHGVAYADVHLWTSDAPDFDLEAHPAWPAWQAWAALVADRFRLSDRLDSILRAHRTQHDEEEPRVRRAKLEALAEFAAGAGHELNNPLAVIVGRAQLLLAQETDPGAARSLRAILAQAQRAHRILRDLIYIARPPEPRPRFCQPDEIVRNCLRDLKADAEARGLKILAEGAELVPKVWADHDALRHLLESLIRNALEATPRGGQVRVTTSGDARTLRWTVQDNGRGLTATEARHLFDPFYCGRQAGRGLGLGLTRSARIVELYGGELRWHSAPGQGSIFQIHLPLTAPPEPLPPSPAPARADAG
jgi:signal transduction histidine kinase